MSRLPWTRRLLERLGFGVILDVTDRVVDHDIEKPLLGHASVAVTLDVYGRYR